MMEKWLMLMSIKCFKSAVSINNHRFTITTNSYLGHHETEDYNVILSWKVCSASIKCIIISVISVSWSLYFSLPPPYDLAPPLHWPGLFFLVSEGENWRRRRRVFECAYAAECDKLKCWLLIPERQLREDDMHCCSAKTSKFVYHLPRPWYGITQNVLLYFLPCCELNSPSLLLSQFSFTEHMHHCSWES